MRYIATRSAGLHATSIGAGASDDSKHADLIDQLTPAIKDHMITLLVSWSIQARDPAEQEVYPLGMIPHRGSLQLIGWSARQDEVRNFKVDQMDGADVQILQ